MTKQQYQKRFNLDGRKNTIIKKSIKASQKMKDKMSFKLSTTRDFKLSQLIKKQKILQND